jgi:hypothetical protein
MATQWQLTRSVKVPQILKNWQRCSAEGLSITMFLFTIGANLCSGSSILLRTKVGRVILVYAPTQVIQ